MQLFSRKKALVAVSLSALVALGACGDNVTVPVTPPPAVNISITPMSANMNVGERLNFAVQIIGGSTTTPPTLASCTSSNTAVATSAVAGSACAVTAVAPGNASITAAASTGNQAAAVVQVAAISPAITSLAVSPSAAQLAVGQSVTLVGTVQPAGRTVAYTYATSSAAIATVSATGVVLAVAPGFATITVTATGSGTGFGSATISQAVTITVSDRVPGLTALNVQPNSLALSLGQTSTLVASAVGPSSSTAVITFGTNTPSVATVNVTTGVVTGVSPGTAVITVTATSPQSGSFAASTITSLIPVTVAQGAQVSIQSITGCTGGRDAAVGSCGGFVDISNTAGQIQVTLNVTPNGQTVTSAQVYICDRGQTPCPSVGQPIAAQQTFTAQGGNLSVISLLINTAEFDSPNFTTGENANTYYKNGLKTIIATLSTASGSVASNNISNINFNNADGFAVQWNRPSNRTLGSNAITYYGGPDTPDGSIAGASAGFGSFVVVPVLYTPALDIRQTVLSLNTNGIGANVCPGNAGAAITDSVRPFSIRYGAGARVSDNFAATPLYQTCTIETNGALGTQVGPAVLSSVDNKNDPGPTAFTLNPTPALNAINNDFRLSTFYRPGVTQGYEPISIDYVRPTISRFQVRGGGAISVDSGWVNGAYAFNSGISFNNSAYANIVTTVGGQGCPDGLASTNAQPSRYCVTDAGVGLLVARNAVFDVFAVSQVDGTTRQVTGTAVASGPIGSTIASLGLGESSADFTNGAYVARASETDRLGNRRTTVPYDNPTTTLVNEQNPVDAPNTLNNAVTFGVDLTPPVVVTLPNNPGQGGPNGFIAGSVRTDIDSIYSTLGATYGGVDANTAVFASRFTDSRSGFFTCNPVTVGTPAGSGTGGLNIGNCPAFAGAGQVAAGSFQITRRTVPNSVSITNDAVVENLVQSTANGTTANVVPTNRLTSVMNSTLNPNDNSQRDFVIAIFGQPVRYSAAVATPVTKPIAAATAGYYTFTGTLNDRAGNTTALNQRSVAIDNAAPQVTGVLIPGVLTGGSASVAFVPAGTDDLEAISGDLALTYPQLGAANGAVGVTGATLLQFARVPNFVIGMAADPKLGLWHNPFQSLTDNKLTTPVGPGIAFSTSAQGLTVPISFLQAVQTTDAASAPLTPAAVPGNIKPTGVTTRLFDIRSTATSTTAAFSADSGRSLPIAQVIFAQQVTSPSSPKDWTAAGAGIQSWSAFNPGGSSGTVEYRVQTSTSITNPPFSSVYVIRQDAGGTSWQFLGTAQFIGPLDQGGNRFWRYSFTYAGQAQGVGGGLAAFNNGDQIRAIGADASGNGLSSLTTTLGVPNALTGAAAVTLSAATPATLTNGAAAYVTAVGAAPNTNLVNLGANCTSSNPAFLTATMGANNVCTLQAVGVVSAGSSVSVTVTYSVTGSLAGFNTSTITSTGTVSRIP